MITKYLSHILLSIFLAIIICFIIKLVVSIYVNINIKMIDKKFNMHIPSFKYQVDSRTCDFDPDKDICYIDHFLIDSNNIRLEFKHSVDIYVKKFILELSEKYNIIMIVSDSIDDDISDFISYNTHRVLNYCKVNNLPIYLFVNNCKKKLIRKRYSVYSDNIIDGKVIGTCAHLFYYYIEDKTDNDSIKN